MTDHMLDEMFAGDDGFNYASCMCGWESPPCPGPEEAANFWGQHLLAKFEFEYMQQEV